MHVSLDDHDDDQVLQISDDLLNFLEICPEVFEKSLMNIFEGAALHPKAD